MKGTNKMETPDTTEELHDEANYQLCNPTWYGLLPILLEGWKNGNKSSWEELQRMAQLADSVTK
jgi:hypothetical protein